MHIGPQPEGAQTVKTTHRSLATLTAVALLALGGTAAANAEERPGRGEVRSTERAEKCDRLAELIAKLERAKQNLKAKIARVEEKIASGELTPEQQARAREVLAWLNKRLAKVEEKLARAKELWAQKCSGSDAPTSEAPAA